MLDDSDYTIVSQFQAEYRGLVQYYLLAQDVFRLGKLRWVMETSLLKTLAGNIVRCSEDGTEVQSDNRHHPWTANCFRSDGPTRRGEKAIGAQFGGIPLYGSNRRYWWMFAQHLHH